MLKHTGSSKQRIPLSALMIWAPPSPRNNGMIPVWVHCFTSCTGCSSAYACLCQPWQPGESSVVVNWLSSTALSCSRPARARAQPSCVVTPTLLEPSKKVSFHIKPLDAFLRFTTGFASDPAPCATVCSCFSLSSFEIPGITML